MPARPTYAFDIEGHTVVVRPEEKQHAKPNYPRLIGGTTTIGQISKAELKEIQERLKTQPKRSLKDINRKHENGVSP